jgi:surface antigen
MGKFHIVAAALGVLALAACANDPAGVTSSTTAGGGSNAYTGSVPGAPDHGALAPGPATTGTLSVPALDPRDREPAAAAQQRALQFGEPGAPVAWRSPESGHHGTIVPGPAYQSNGTTCREFSHTVYVDGRPQTGRGSACRNPNGTWTPQS